jgi:hypothetical protein
MTIVRLLISAFIVVLIVIAAAGWIWTGEHMPTDQMLWGRAALAGCVVAGVVGLAAVWKDRRVASR